MTELNIGAGLAPAPPGDLRDVGPELRRYTVRALLDATASSIRLAFPGTLLLEAQVLAIQVKNWGWLIELTDDTADSTAAAPRLRCLASKRTLIEIEEEIGQPLTPELLRGASAILKVRATFHNQHGFGLRLTGLDPAFGAGLVGKHIEQIRQTLMAEGIYANQHLLPAPSDVRTVAVIAPANSAARSDIASELGRWERRGILNTVTWIDAHFEGAGGVKSLTGALVNACSLARIRQAESCSSSEAAVTLPA